MVTQVILNDNIGSLIVIQVKRSITKDVRYDSPTSFTCFNGEKTIPASAVNDDYCDCKDASDEPGTSACQEGRFYCLNLHHKGEYILSPRVNDSLCGIVSY